VRSPKADFWTALGNCSLVLNESGNWKNNLGIHGDAERHSTSCSTISTERFVGSFGSQANFTCPIGHFMTEHTGVTEVLHPVLAWENETTIVATTSWIEPTALETTAYSDGAR